MRSLIGIFIILVGFFVFYILAIAGEASFITFLLFLLLEFIGFRLVGSHNSKKNPSKSYPIQKPLGCIIMLSAAIWFIYTMYVYDDVGGFEGTMMWIVFFIGLRFASNAPPHKNERGISKDQDEPVRKWREENNINFKSTFHREKEQDHFNNNLKTAKEEINSSTWYNEKTVFPDKYEFKAGEFTCYYLFNYYPMRSYAKVPKEIASERGLIYDFKDGINSKKVADMISSAIYNRFKLNDKERIIFAIIPASTHKKTISRFEQFCKRVCENLKIKNGFKLIRRSSDREDMRQVGHGIDRLEGIEHGRLYKGETVILFDDIATTGKSFRLNAEKFMSLGASKIIGVFLGKTWDKKYNGHPEWYNVENQTDGRVAFDDEDDLPF